MASLEDVGKSPGGDSIVGFLRVSHNDDGSLKNTAGAANLSFVAAPTGVAATDTAAIQAAHDSLPSEGGIVQLDRGSYAIDPVTALSFSKPITLRGHGKVSPRDGTPEGFSTTAATMLTFDSMTATCITCSTTATFAIEHLGIVNTHLGTPTAGAGIAVTGAKVAGFRIVDVSVVGFYCCIDIQQGSEWLINGCYIGDFVSDGIRIQNQAAFDTGDMTICNSWIYCGPHTLASPNGIQWQSGGGLRLENNKFNNLPAVGFGGQAIYFNPAASVVTSDLFVVGNSIENFNYGIAFSFSPGAGSSLEKIILSSNEIYAANTCISLAPGSTGLYAYVAILGNVFSGNGSATGLHLDKVDSMTYGPNVYGTGLSTPLSVGTITNSLKIGNG